MSIIGNNILAGASGGAAGFEIQRSLRFNDGDTAYLNKTFSSAGNRQAWTWSAWVKRGDLGTGRFVLFGGYGATNDTDWLEIGFNSNGVYATVNTVTTTGTDRFRDPSAWYHYVVNYNGSYVKWYINGEEVHSWARTGNLGVNGGHSHTIGKSPLSTITRYFDGYLAEVHFIDGQTLDGSSFAETDSKTGAWIPKKYSGTSYGTNGFYLRFLDNSDITATTLGKDSSGNGNNFTPNSFSVSTGAGNDSLEDTPTNNWCTINPLIKTSSTLSNGNLKIVTPTGSGPCYATFNLPTSGKWYWEFVPTANGNLSFSGIGKPLATSTYIAYYGNSGQKWISGSSSAYGATYGNNDVIGVAVNVDSNEITFYKNNTSQGAITGYTLNEGNYAPNFSDGSSGAGTTFDVNFGQRAFAYTPPTGFKALNTANLPVPTVKNGTEYFKTKLYTGNSTTQPITGVGFQPDFIWIKDRTVANSHVLTDAVRGRGKRLVSNNTGAESAEAAADKDLISFDPDGFTVGQYEHGTYNANSDAFVAWNWDAGANSSKTFTVKVVSDSGNKYRFDDFGTSAVTLDLEEGSTYVFDQSDSSNSGHPLRFSTTSDGTHNSGSEYTTGVTTTGTPGSTGAKTTIVVAASAPTLYYYCSAHSGMGGQANTNSTAGASNFAGSIQSTCRASAEAGISIVRYTGTGANATVGHNLNQAPEMVIVKDRDRTTDWSIMAQPANNGSGHLGWIRLNLTNAWATTSILWNNTAPTSSVFSIGTYDYVNYSGSDYIALCFNSVEGYSKIGSYTGNGSADGVFIYTGFKPAFVMFKGSSVASNWCILDSTRDTFNVTERVMQANSSAAESTTLSDCDFLSNGIKIRSVVSNDTNVSGHTYIYMAFAETPFKYATAR